jgi:hypothetical protein
MLRHTTHPDFLPSVQCLWTGSAHPRHVARPSFLLGSASSALSSSRLGLPGVFDHLLLRTGSSTTPEGRRCPRPPPDRRMAPAPIDACRIKAQGEDSSLVVVTVECCCSILIFCSMYDVAGVKMLTGKKETAM